jgi:hypothetical protein
MISDILSDAIDDLMTYLFDEVDQPRDFYDAVFVREHVFPVMDAMYRLQRRLDDPSPGDYLTCVPCGRRFPDVVSIWRHRRTHRPSLADVAMGEALQRPDITIVQREDLMPLQEADFDDGHEGTADVMEVERYVCSIPADCSTCREQREAWAHHIRRAHELPRLDKR